MPLDPNVVSAAQSGGFMTPGSSGQAAYGQSQSTSGSTGTGQSQSVSGTQIVPGMLDVYNQLLGKNTENYQNIINAYTGGAGQLSGALPGIYGGYGALGNQVQNTLGMGQVLGQNGNWGVATPAAQAIGRSFQQAQSNTQQQMAGAGLGNTTVGGNLQNQNALNAGLAYGSLGAQLAQTAAGYQASLGTAGLGAQMQGLGMQNSLNQAYMGGLANYRFANTAGNLTGGFGSSSSSNQSNSFGNSLSNNSSAGFARANYYPGGGGGGGYVPSMGGTPSLTGRSVPTGNINPTVPSDIPIGGGPMGGGTFGQINIPGLGSGGYGPPPGPVNLGMGISQGGAGGTGGVPGGGVGTGSIGQGGSFDMTDLGVNTSATPGGIIGGGGGGGGGFQGGGQVPPGQFDPTQGGYIDPTSGGAYLPSEFGPQGNQYVDENGNPIDPSQIGQYYDPTSGSVQSGQPTYYDQSGNPIPYDQIQWDAGTAPIPSDLGSYFGDQSYPNLPGYDNPNGPAGGSDTNYDPYSSGYETGGGTAYDPYAYDTSGTGYDPYAYDTSGYGGDYSYDPSYDYSY